MEPFPVAPELMQAFPLGALTTLVAVASTVVAQHGVDNARSVFRELATNDELWTFIANRVVGRAEATDDGPPDTDRGMTVPSELAPAPPLETPSPTERLPIDEVTAELHPEPLQARARTPRPRRRRSDKPNGAGE